MIFFIKYYMHVYENLVAFLLKIILISQQPLHGSNVYMQI